MNYRKWNQKTTKRVVYDLQINLYRGSLVYFLLIKLACLLCSLIARVDILFACSSAAKFLAANSVDAYLLAANSLAA